MGAVIAFLVAFGTALASATLGLFPDLLLESDGELRKVAPRLLNDLPGSFDGRGPYFVFLCVGSLAAFGAAIALAFHRQRILDSRGTAYNIEVQGDGWATYSTDAFVKGISRHFAQVMQVPDPRSLGLAWSWKYDLDSATRWGQYVDILADSFMTLWRVDNRLTKDVLFLRASWPVALRLGQVMPQRSREFQIEVRRRPSRGLGGSTDADDWRHRGTDFGLPVDPQTLSSLGATEHHHGPVRLVVEGTMPSTRTCHVILLRATGTAPWMGALTLDGATGKAIDLRNATGQEIGEVGEVREWRAVAPSGSHPREAYGALAKSAADFVRRSVAEIKDQAPEGRPLVVLLGTLLPQEVSFGLGINLSNGLALPVYPCLSVDSNTMLVALGMDLGSVTPRGPR